jgi:hypothetical protein
MSSREKQAEVLVKDAKQVFRKLGTCSRTFFYLINREFGTSMEVEERASDLLAGGIMKKGYQCGMLWGASLAVGAEAFEVCAHRSQAIAVSIEATKILMDSFETHESTTQCREITKCDFESKLSFAKYMISGQFLHCFQLAEDWAPDAVIKAKKALQDKPYDFEHAVSCATEVAQKMGASEKEMVMVAGFAGGLGLSGSACGGLSAALWMNALNWCREHKAGSAIEDPKAKELMRSFKVFTDEKYLCQEISQTHFNSVKEHTDYIKNGGCSELISALSQI